MCIKFNSQIHFFLILKNLWLKRNWKKLRNKRKTAKREKKQKLEKITLTACARTGRMINFMFFGAPSVIFRSVSHCAELERLRQKKKLVWSTHFDRKRDNQKECKNDKNLFFCLNKSAFQREKNHNYLI